MSNAAISKSIKEGYKWILEQLERQVVGLVRSVMENGHMVTVLYTKEEWDIYKEMKKKIL